MRPRSTNRRTLLVATSTLAAGLAGWPRRGPAAVPVPVPARVGLLLLGAPEQRDEVDRNLLIGLNELGYAEGRNLLLERRYAHSELARLAGFAQEFVEKKFDAIVTTCTPTTRAARSATTRIPIVMIAVSDPVASAFVESLARPGTNVTGRSSQSNDIVPKMLDLFVQSVPRADPLAVLVNVTNPAQEPLWQHALQVAQALKLDLQRIELRSAQNLRGEDLPAAFERAGAGRAGGVFVLPDDPMNLLNRARIIALAQQHRLPSLFGPSEFAEAGGLLSYGESIADSARLSARHVDRLVRGASPDTLPVEQPTRFELVFNLKTARQLGVAIPKDMLVIADRVIE